MRIFLMRSHQGLSTCETILAETNRSNHAAIPWLTFGVEFPAIGITVIVNVRFERVLMDFH